jgi:hypothetical protein
MRVSTKELVCLAVLVLPAFSPAEAALTISSAPMANVTCAKAICTATAADAVLNVGRLQRMLAVENPKVVSGSIAGDIVIAAALSWPSTHILTLDSYRSVIVNKPVAVTGTGGLTILTNDGGGPGGSFSFGNSADIAFWDLSSKLTIDGWPYTLVNDWATFIQTEGACDNSRHIALVASLNAGTSVYLFPPIGLCGSLEGLGNTISNLTMTGQPNNTIGLFVVIGSNALVENLTFANVQITGRAYRAAALAVENDGRIAGVSVNGSLESKNRNGGTEVGALVGRNLGTITNSHSSATVQGSSEIGGLVAENFGVIRASSSTGAIHGSQSVSIAGGFVGSNYGVIDGSYATGLVVGWQAGGLVGQSSVAQNSSSITNSYATGEVKFSSTAAGSLSGGLIAFNHYGSVISSSYAAGHVSRVVSGSDNLAGGLIAEDDSLSGSITASYWDITTSHTKTATGIGSASGISGLTTTQLQSGLPTGFDPSIWGENPSINGGLPYLLGNPPT